MKSMEYIRVCKTLKDYGTLVPISDDIYKYVDLDKDYYRSIFVYNEEQYQHFLAKNSIAGIENVLTNKLIFDLDKDGDLEQAKNDAITIAERLTSRGFAENSIQLFFSGNKGFHVEVDLKKFINPKQFRSIVFTIAKDLSSFDNKIYNPSRIIRLPFTRHQTSGLYKAPFTLSELKELNIEEIKTLSKTVDEYDIDEYRTFYKPSDLPLDLETIEYKDVSPQERDPLAVKEILHIDWSQKPKWLSKCKYSLAQGFFKEGMRDDVFTALAATYKNQGFPEPVVSDILRGVATLQSAQNDCEPFSERDIRKCSRSVFKPTWKGGDYSCKSDGWLRDYCNEHGFDCSVDKEDIDSVVIDTGRGLNKFTEYALNIDNNTIKFGIKELDELLRFQIGHLVGVLAPPAVGKTSFALTVLNNTALAGVDSLFLSYDMHSAILFQKLIQRETGMTADQVYDIYRRKDTDAIKKIEEVLHTNYANVGFCFKSGQSIEQIKNTIKYREEKLGRPIKLVVVDYLELIQSPYSDPTQSSAHSIQGLREIANELNKAVIVLLQPNKMSSTIDEPITTYNAIKGSSAIAQASTAIITAHRPGYDSRKPENDKFFSIDCVKNRMGPLFSLDFSWHGLTGKIAPLSIDGRRDLKNLKDEKDDKKKKSEDLF